MGEYGTAFQNEPVDVSEEFARQENHFFVGVGSSTAEGLLCLPESGELRRLRLEREGDGFALQKDPLQEAVEWKVRASGDGRVQDG
jgi:hypothetical protein